MNAYTAYLHRSYKQDQKHVWTCVTVLTPVHLSEILSAPNKKYVSNANMTRNDKNVFMLIGHYDLKNRSRSYRIGGAHLQYGFNNCTKFERSRWNPVRVRDYTMLRGTKAPSIDSYADNIFTITK